MNIMATPKQKLFIEEYLIDLNATQAAVRAGYSKKTAYSIGQENLKKPEIMAAIKKAMDDRSDRAKINAEWVLKRVALIANFNIKKFITTSAEGTAWYDFSAATDNDWYCISEYTHDLIVKGVGDDKHEVNRVKLKTFDKLRALELVGKHVGVQAFKNKVEVSGEP
jgi:phage terminase small subunit